MRKNIRFSLKEQPAVKQISAVKFLRNNASSNLSLYCSIPLFQSVLQWEECCTYIPRNNNNYICHLIICYSIYY